MTKELKTIKDVEELIESMPHLFGLDKSDLPPDPKRMQKIFLDATARFLIEFDHIPCTIDLIQEYTLIVTKWSWNQKLKNVLSTDIPHDVEKIKALFIDNPLIQDGNKVFVPFEPTIYAYYDNVVLFSQGQEYCIKGKIQKKAIQDIKSKYKDYFVMAFK